MLRFCWRLTVLKDLIALGGILHTIDRVLELPIGPVQSFIAQNLSYELALAAEGGFLSSESRPLVDAFFDKSDATYFISNSAKALADANLTAVNQTTLLQFIGYDAAPQVIYSTAFANGTQIMTDLGVPLFVTVQDGDTYINFAKVTSVDNFVSNGVFHVIDE